MFFPYNTDAPIYYWPVATVGLIIVNVLAYLPVLTSDGSVWDEPGGGYESYEFDEDDGPQIDEWPQIDPEQGNGPRVPARIERPKSRAKATSSGWSYRLLALEFGKFRPWQWLTANYMHAGFFHLLGNMLVLWGFGLVVEGKIGWWRYLLLYNLIGVAGWFVVQVLMLPASQGIGLGASLAIFGLVAIAMVWAPSNELSCVMLLGFRVITFEATIYTVATFAVFLQVAISLFHVAFTMSGMGRGLTLTSELLHLIGGVFGFAAGVVMLKKGWVDCENWDLFSVWTGKNEQPVNDHAEEKLRQLTAAERAVAATSPAKLQEQRQTRLTQFRTALSNELPVDAWRVHQQAVLEFPDWRVHELEFIQLLTDLRTQKQWPEAVEAMVFYLRNYSDRATPVRLALGQILVERLGQGGQAVVVLGRLDPSRLNEKQRQAQTQLLAAARQLSAKNPDEFVDPDW